MKSPPAVPCVLEPGMILRALRACRRGDTSVKLPAGLEGIDGEIAATFNEIVEIGRATREEFARVRRDVGRLGRIEQRINVPAAAGAWADGNTAVNALIEDLLRPMAEMTRVAEAVARGDLTQRVPLRTDAVPLRGEMRRAAQVVNRMVDGLEAFVAEVSRVARELGTDGLLGGRAVVPGAAGAWREATVNVNGLAASLTVQVRALSEVADAVAGGDLTRAVAFDARGEAAVLKDAINHMVRVLREGMLKAREQDWLRSNLARFTRILRDHRDPAAASQLALVEVARAVNARQGVFYLARDDGGQPRLELAASYACAAPAALPQSLGFGEGLVGQCAADRERLILDDVPVDALAVSSALLTALPAKIVIFPILFDGRLTGVIEIASQEPLAESRLAFLEEAANAIGILFDDIAARARAEMLSGQSQSLAEALQERQRELEQSNERLERQARDLQGSERLLESRREALQRAHSDLEEKTGLLSQQVAEIERKNGEIERARSALEENAEQFMLSTRHKSEFLATVAHELRTPLNSLLLLAKLLADNPGGRLGPKEVEYATTIQGAGIDLLALINDLLDLAKIESGTFTMEYADEPLAAIRDSALRNFNHVADSKGLAFEVAIDPALGPTVRTDGKRLDRILKNLLANAFKFTERGAVTLRIEPARSGWTPGHAQLDLAPSVLAFVVTDTGIGVPDDSRQLIFEAFRQAEGTTSRRFGGTGLGLSISRELAQLLNGEICVDSTPGEGSSFTLYLPAAGEPAPPAAQALARAAASLASAVPVAGADAGAAAPAGADFGTPGAGADPDGIGATRGAVPSFGELAGRKLLVVDDDIRNIFTLTGALEEFGLRVCHAESGEEGIEVLRSSHGIDAVLVDITMPGMDGYETIRRIRSLEQFRRLPVIAVTAKAAADDRRKCVEAGATDDIARPINVEQLMSLLRVVLGTSPAADAAPEGPRPAC